MGIDFWRLSCVFYFICFSVDNGFDEHDIPYDMLWLDIEHTDGKKYDNLKLHVTDLLKPLPC